MAKTIEQAYVNTYERNVRQLAQQGITRLRPFVTEKGEQSESHNWETLDEQETDIGTSSQTTGMLKRSAGDVWAGPVPTPNNDEVWEKRRTLINTYDAGNSTELEDPRQMLVDPNSAITISQSMKMRRAVDDVIITNAFSPATIKDGSTVAFPASQEIGDGTTPISFDLVTAVTELFLINDIDPMEGKVFIIGPTQMRKLLQITEATNFDYVNAKELSGNGYISNWMGFSWLVSTRLEDPGGLGDELNCIVMTKRALGLHVAKDIYTQVAQDPSASFAWRIYSCMSMDCVRVEDKHIVKVHVADTL
jgi:Phage capsid protein